VLSKRLAQGAAGADFSVVTRNLEKLPVKRRSEMTTAE